jgi:uracil-DNA glycosylase
VTSWQELADSAASCTRCDLYKRATATVFGSRFRVRDHKGEVEEVEFGPWRGLVVSTIHPSAVLRGDDPEARERSFAGLVADLVTARGACSGDS